MSKSGAEKIQFILNNHEQAYRRLKPVYTFLELASWISVVLLIIYLSGKNGVSLDIENYCTLRLFFDLVDLN